MGFVTKSSGLLLVVIGGLIGATGGFSPDHSGRVLTYVGMCLMCFGVVTALVSATFDRTKYEGKDRAHHGPKGPFAVPGRGFASAKIIKEWDYVERK